MLKKTSLYNLAFLLITLISYGCSKKYYIIFDSNKTQSSYWINQKIDTVNKIYPNNGCPLLLQRN